MEQVREISIVIWERGGAKLRHKRLVLFKLVLGVLFSFSSFHSVRVVVSCIVLRYK